MKAYCLITISRQLNGEAVGIRIDKCSTSLDNIKAFASGLAAIPVETVQTPQGSVQFSCERGIHEIDVEE